MNVTALDHLVLTVRDIDTTCHFYQSVLNLAVITFGAGRRALRFGRQKINLHTSGAEFAPHASQATPGAADLCFLTDTSTQDVLRHLHDEDVAIIVGPVNRVGAVSSLRSVYYRDPDGNLIEIANEQ